MSMNPGWTFGRRQSPNALHGQTRLSVPSDEVI